MSLPTSARVPTSHRSESPKRQRTEGRLIKNNPDVGYQTTKPADFDHRDMHSAEELSNIWKEVKTIFLDARDCKDGSRDENVWCDDRVRPLIYLTMELYGDERWWFQNFQSQSIDSPYPSTIPAPTFTDPTRRKPIDRKTYYVLSYPHSDPDTALYKRLDNANKKHIGHTVDAFTKRTTLFSGFETRSASGNHTKAELQMSIWAAASAQETGACSLGTGFV
ncbi:hypothetical protein BS50DRAFT_641591 [Corynespora cassiicola Philippines]|uniref:PD-(D/E)XK nuclease-like domain-containing protein n=1 Tax=Corynespora cassiicola Philippines TaxID=1448308 RepID=A0A2T2MZW1_CORCC|nr:hypothetical protein BS50DRAFT_641591 [Corynespora cassiicola Philippines]